MSERRYWLDEHSGYVPLSDFPPLLLAIREAEGAAGWKRRHPPEPTLEQRTRDIAERRTGMPAYLVDDETWAAAEVEAALAHAEAPPLGPARRSTQERPTLPDPPKRP